MRKSEKRGNLEVRLHDDGSMDEIVVRDAQGRCLFHLEQMDSHVYWMRAYNLEPGQPDVVVHVRSQARHAGSDADVEEARRVGVELDGSRVVGDHEWEG